MRTQISTRRFRNKRRMSHLVTHSTNNSKMQSKAICRSGLRKSCEASESWRNKKRFVLVENRPSKLRHSKARKTLLCRPTRSSLHSMIRALAFTRAYSSSSNSLNTRSHRLRAGTQVVRHHNYASPPTSTKRWSWLRNFAMRSSRRTRGIECSSK